MVETGIQTVLPDNLAGMLMPLPDIETFKLKCQKSVVGRQKLCFALMLKNTREKEIF